MKKLQLVEKAWELNLDKIREGYLYDERIVYGDTINLAKSTFIKKFGWEAIELNSTDESVTYCTIPLRRCKIADKYLFEEKTLTKREIDEILKRRAEHAVLDAFFKDPAIKWCYIMKRGLYYMPESCGYTGIQDFAGVYTIQEGVSNAKACRELVIVPIDILKHNERLQKRIEEIQNNLLSV